MRTARSWSPRSSAVRRRLVALVVVLGALPVGAPGASGQSTAAPSTLSVVEDGATIALPATPARALGVPSPVSVVLVEASTGQILAAQDAETRRPIASAIKLLTALVVVDALPAGTTVTVGDEVRGIEGSSYGLRPGETRSVEDLLAGLLLRSGNDVAVALAIAVAGSEEAFVDRMADRLAVLGIDARPGSASGLEETDALTATELAVVARAALAEPRIGDLVGRTVVDLPGGVEVENRNAFLVDDPTATGLKTGFTNAAGFTLAASAEREGRPLIAVVLGAKDDQERRDVVRRLIEHGYASTTPTRVESSLGLRTTGGPVELRIDLGTLTVPVGAGLRVAWPEGIRPTDASVRVPLVVGDQDAGEVQAVRRDGRAEGPPVASLGRALADGAYAALRPGAIRTLGSSERTPDR